MFDSPELSPREFYISTFVVWGQKSLEGAVGNAISKRKWEEEMRDYVRQQEERQRVIHGQYGMATPPSSLDIPLNRPDCLDDVVSLCTSLFSLGGDFASQLWTDAYPEPPRVVRDLERQQLSDGSLQPCFLSFLGALACAAPNAVHELQNWDAHLLRIQHYTRLLNPQSDQRAGSRQSSAPLTTQYYYISEHSSGTSSGQTGDRSTSSPLPSDADTAALRSLLYLISVVAKHSVRVRLALVSMDVPVRNGRETVNRVSLLSMLMTLSVQALSPAVRGAVFSTIASILRTDDCSNEQELSLLRKAAAGVWELVEQSQILPISELELQRSAPESEQRQTQKPGLAFPSSSISMVRLHSLPGASAHKVVSFQAEQRVRSLGNCPFGAPKFGILYEMECVESSLGCYPSTEGFLRLLAALFAGGGCPPGLGQDWRARPGCLPYLEYVVQYVLPRASGNYSTLPSLEFRVVADRDRLEWLALSVVEVALNRYSIPSPKLLRSYRAGSKELVEELRQSNEEAATDAIGYEYLEKLLFIPPLDDAEAKSACDDFLELAPADPSSLCRQRKTPRSQMPGFFAIVELLSASSSPFFKSVVSVLTDYHEGSPLKRTLGDWIRVQSLYLSTPPTFSTAKMGALHSTQSLDRQRLIPSFANPPMDTDRLEEDAIPWSTRARRSALVVLCAALARESSFSRASEGKRVAYVPVLRFSGTREEALHLKPISGLLFNVSPSSLESVWFSLTKNAGFVSSDPEVDLQVSSVSAGVLFYLLGSIGAQRVPSMPQQVLSQSLAVQLEIYAGRQESKGHREFLGFLLGRILSDLRSGHDAIFVNSLLNSSSPLFRALLSLLSNSEFLIGNTQLVCVCFEIIYRITTLTNDLPSVVSVGQRSQFLRSVDFWVGSVRRIFDLDVAAPKYNLTLSLSWILKSVAQQLYLLSGSFAEMSVSPDIRCLLHPMPEKFNGYLIELLGNDGLLFKSLDYISLGHPIESTEIPRVFDHSGARDALAQSHDTTCEEIQSQKLMRKLSQLKLAFDEQEVYSWIQHWNTSAAELSAASHLSEAISVVLGSLQVIMRNGGHSLGSGFSSCIHRLVETNGQL